MLIRPSDLHVSAHPGNAGPPLGEQLVNSFFDQGNTLVDTAARIR